MIGHHGDRVDATRPDLRDFNRIALVTISSGIAPRPRDRGLNGVPLGSAHGTQGEITLSEGSKRTIWFDLADDSCAQEQAS